MLKKKQFFISTSKSAALPMSFVIWWFICSAMCILYASFTVSEVDVFPLICPPLLFHMVKWLAGACKWDSDDSLYNRNLIQSFVCVLSQGSFCSSLIYCNAMTGTQDLIHTVQAPTTELYSQIFYPIFLKFVLHFYQSFVSGSWVDHMCFVF